MQNAVRDKTRSFNLAKLAFDQVQIGHGQISQKFQQKSDLHVKYCENSKKSSKQYNCHRILREMKKLIFDFECQTLVLDYAYEILLQAYDNEKSSQSTRKNK
jgi:hypothetical protein